jgi:predicted RNA-binding Zn-ribbon protein involved in translation (DUF1610 family)
MEFNASRRSVRMSQEEYEYLVFHTDRGVCLACGTEMEGVEPDAENYVCVICGELEVFGLETLMAAGVITFNEE